MRVRDVPSRHSPTRPCGSPCRRSRVPPPSPRHPRSGSPPPATRVDAPAGAVQAAAFFRRLPRREPVRGGVAGSLRDRPGGGADLGISELAENLGSDVYMDINVMAPVPERRPATSPSRASCPTRSPRTAPIRRAGGGADPERLPRQGGRRQGRREAVRPHAEHVRARFHQDRGGLRGRLVSALAIRPGDAATASNWRRSILFVCH